MLSALPEFHLHSTKILGIECASADVLELMQLGPDMPVEAVLCLEPFLLQNQVLACHFGRGFVQARRITRFIHLVETLAKKLASL